jgi:hypothetical protein
MTQLDTVYPAWVLAMITTTGKSAPVFLIFSKLAIDNISNRFPIKVVPANFL